MTMVVLLLLNCISSCKKLVTVAAPITSVNSASVYTSDATAISVLTGMYTQMSQSITNGGLTSSTFFPALSADEFVLYSGANNAIYTAYYTNNLSSTNVGADMWVPIYKMVFYCNSALEGLAGSSGLTPAIKQQLTGEAEFMRAFCYFYLVNLYGDVPLVLSTDYKSTATMAKAPQAQVDSQIVADLKNAQNNLSTSYLDGTLLNVTPQRVRPTKWAATALLARTYLYEADYADAETQATAIINNSGQYALTGLNSVFLMNSQEAIWQLQAINSGQNTPDAWLFIIPTTGLSSSHPVYLRSSLLNSFEPNDQRKVDWINVFIDQTVTPNNYYYYPYKYKSATLNAPITEYEMVLRLGEQYLIRAEAEAQLNDLTDAANDLNTIRTRANLPAISNSIAASQPALVAAILHERQVELFTEWGHRWFDLKRTGNIDAVMDTVAVQKGGTWSSYKALYPIDASNLLDDPNLVQTPGY